MSLHLFSTVPLVELSDLFGMDVLHAWSWSLLHSLWQAGLVSLVLAALLMLTKNSQAALRYQLSVIGMLSCFVLNAATFFSYFQKSVLTLSFSHQGRVATYIPVAHENHLLAQLSVFVNQHLSQIVFIWSLGFVLLGTKSFWHWWGDQRLLRRDTQALPSAWEIQCQALARNMHLQKTVRFRLSDKITVPCVIAFFKPVVLLPASLLLGMSPQQIEVIVLHELAHIKRHDVLLVSLQCAMKALYFFNPFVFWISAQLDQERENACDDIAVGICNNPLLYAKTLHDFAEMHSHFLSTSTALTGRKNMLQHRIKRLFVTDKPSVKSTRKLISTAILLSMGLTSAAYAWMQMDGRGTVNLSAKNMPIQQLLQQAESACPGSIGKIKLRQPDMNVNVNFSNVACSDVVALFGDMQERYGMRFNEVRLDAALSIFKQQCPTVFRQVTLKNPSALYTHKLLDATCLEILEAVAVFDATHK